MAKTRIQLAEKVKRQCQGLSPKPSNTVIVEKLNEGVSIIAGGVIMPNTGEISPPLQDLYTSSDVTTDTDEKVDLPTTFQRQLFRVFSDTNDENVPIMLSFQRFLDEYEEMDTAGSIEYVCVKGNQLYYANIPATADTLTLHFYRKPVDMATDSTEPDGIPEHLQEALLVNFAMKEILFDLKKDGAYSAGKVHEARFIEAMLSLVKFEGSPESGPIHIGNNFNTGGWDNVGI